MKRPGGLLIRASSAPLMGADQALQVASGRAALPVRVLNTTPDPLPRHCKWPHRAMLVPSWTCDSYDPAPVSAVSNASRRAGLLSPAYKIGPALRIRVASPSPASTSNVALPSDKV